MSKLQTMSEVHLLLSALLSATLFVQGVAAAAGDAPAGDPAAPAFNASSTDACSTLTPDTYNLRFHVAGIFIVFGTSAVGNEWLNEGPPATPSERHWGPMIARRRWRLSGSRSRSTGTLTVIGLSNRENLKNNQTVLFVLHLLKFFGIGVIAATAWIHLLPDAFSNFTNTCLTGYWNVYGGGNYVGLFGLTAAFIVQIFEIIAMNYDAKHHGHSHDHSTNIPIHKLTLAAEALPNPSSTALTLAETAGHTHGSENGLVVRNKELGTVILEAGILFHSLIIGVTLGTTTDSGFSSLLIAICFHQFTEGTGLGVLIGELKYGQMYKFFVMGLMYPMTTPVGIAIGVAIRNTYNPNSQTALVVQGIMDSLAAGILMYNAYAELMALEVNNSLKLRNMSGGEEGAVILVH
ncbi:ZIP zinc transporter-domain-containing protein, partial [Blyttiomyces helicus]